MTGYLSSLYATSLAEFGIPRQLPNCGGWILERSIPGFDGHDAMGCYPLFVCQDWTKLETDLRDLDGQLVSVALVTDPFGAYASNDLQKIFDVTFPFKEHYVVCLDESPQIFISKHHRYYSRKMLQKMQIESCSQPLNYIDEWCNLYRVLTERHELEGIKAFSRKAFEYQLSIPGLVMLRVIYQGKCIGAHLWYIQGDVAYSHLMALSIEGYQLYASYALYWSAIEFFKNNSEYKIRWLDLGAGAGTSNDGNDGLTFFKRGWTNITRQVWFCGRILNPDCYHTITSTNSIGLTNYFPAYRAGEFNKRQN